MGWIHQLDIYIYICIISRYNRMLREIAFGITSNTLLDAEGSSELWMVVIFEPCCQMWIRIHFLKLGGKFNSGLRRPKKKPSHDADFAGPDTCQKTTTSGQETPAVFSRTLHYQVNWKNATKIWQDKTMAVFKLATHFFGNIMYHRPTGLLIVLSFRSVFQNYPEDRAPGLNLHMGSLNYSTYFGGQWNNRNLWYIWGISRKL